MNRVYISQLMPEKELRDVLAFSGAGLELIDFSISDNLDVFDETMARTLSLLDRLGHPGVSVHGPFLDLNPMSFDSRIARVTADRFKQAYEAALMLGADRVVYHSGMIPTVYYTEGWAERTASFWNRFLEDVRAGSAAGPLVCMENVLDREVTPFLEAAKRVDHPGFGICLDIGHVFCYAADPLPVWIRMLSGRIRHVHLHDNDGMCDLHLALGEGQVPWEAAVKEMLAGPGGKEMTFTIENTSAEAAGKSLAALKTIICNADKPEEWSVES